MPDQSLSWEEIHKGLRIEIPFAVTAGEMEAFAAIAGDYNPLHCDADYAHERGYGGPVVYGALLVSRISYLVGMRLPGRNAVWGGLNIRFRSGLVVGEPATLVAQVEKVSEAMRMFEARIEIRKDGDGTTVATATVSVFYRD